MKHEYEPAQWAIPSFRAFFRAVAIAILLSSLAACGGGGGAGTVTQGDDTSGGGDSGGGDVITAPSAPAPSLSFGLKRLDITWSAVEGATHYRLLQDPDGVSGYGELESELTATTAGVELALHRRDWAAARFIVEACNTAGCTGSPALHTMDGILDAVGYFKASNAISGQNLGWKVALADDGNTLAVSAPSESSAATGVNGDQDDLSAWAAGAVYVYARSAGAWAQQAYLKASNTGSGDEFGSALALSADGNTLAVGAMYEDSSTIGINGSQNNNDADSAGAAYVFVRSGTAWTQQAYLKASNATASGMFGSALGLSDDGNTLAVGARGERSGVVNNPADLSAWDAGAAYVFTRAGGIWSEQAYLKASNPQQVDAFGSALALSGDGDTLAVGAYGEDSSATGINGNQSDESASLSGAVYVFTRSAGSWTQQAYVKASNTGRGDGFGGAVALSQNGDTLAVGAAGETSGAGGVGADQSDASVFNAGAVYVFTRTGGTWSQQVYLKAAHPGEFDLFGSALALSADGNLLAVGAFGEASAAQGFDGDDADQTLRQSGAAYLFTRNDTEWSATRYIKAPKSAEEFTFGIDLALSADGNSLAVGAPGEPGAAVGIGGDQSDTSAPGAGAAYLF